jgi:outer membrane protein OmpA-like peptidoglycan-associated protein
MKMLGGSYLTRHSVSKVAQILVLCLCAMSSSPLSLAMSVRVIQAAGEQPSIESNGHQIKLYSASYALLISETNYSGSSQGGWPRLAATKSELDNVAAVLQTQGFTIWRVEDANSEELNRIYREFMARFGHAPDNRLLFFFSGHGYTNVANDFSYLVPIDARDPTKDSADFFGKALPIASIDTWARELESRHAMFVFDSCFSGSIFVSRSNATSPQQRGSSPGDRDRFFLGNAAQPVRQFLAAGGPKETLPAHSVFVPLFIQAITGAASSKPDGYVTGREIGIWLEQTVPRYNPTENPHSDVIRDPKLSFGDMIFQPTRTSASLARQLPSQIAVVPQTPLAVPPAVSNGATNNKAFPAPTSTTNSFAPMRKVTSQAEIGFSTNKDNVPEQEKAKLDDLAKQIQDMHLEVVVATGYSDGQEGTPREMDRLSIRRAVSVKAYLVSRGVEANRIYSEGKGARTDSTVPTLSRVVFVEVVGTELAQP